MLIHWYSIMDHMPFFVVVIVASGLQPFKIIPLNWSQTNLADKTEHPGSTTCKQKSFTCPACDPSGAQTRSSEGSRYPEAVLLTTCGLYVAGIPG